MSRWATFCAERNLETVRRVVASLDEGGWLDVAPSAEGLRGLVAASRPGELGVVVGPVEDGVSDINLAAALANDGNARCVVLARSDVSGSLRSRAARAGIDLVVDLAEVREGVGGGVPPAMGDGGRSAGEPLPEPVGEDAGSAPEVQGRPVADVGSGVASLGPVYAGVTSAQATPEPSGRAPVLVLSSGRGGAGKTTVASAFAATAARWGMHVCLVDLDLSFGNAYAAFGLSGAPDLAALVQAGQGVTPDLLAGLCVAAAPGVSLCGPCAQPETAELAVPRAGELVACASGAFDLVVVDTSTTYTDAVAQAAQGADRLVLVGDCRASSISSLARLGGLAVRLGVARTRIARLENRVDPRERVNLALARAEVGLEAARVYRVAEGGGEVADLLAAGRVTELVEPGYPFADSVATTLAQLLAELGRLPGHDEADRALHDVGGRRRCGLFGLRREAR